MKPKRSRVPHQSTAVKSPGRGTLGISGWGCAAETLEPLAYRCMSELVQLNFATLY